MHSTGLWLRRLCLATLVMLLGAGVVVGNAVGEGERELELSDEAFNRGDVEAATLHARRAAVAYVPGAPHVDKAYERLLAVALGAEAAGDNRAAKLAWSAVRGAALESTHVFVPRRRELEQANRALARLTARELRRRSVEEESELYQAELRRLHKPPATPRKWVIVVALGFVLTGGGFSWIAARGVARDGRVQTRRVLLGLAIILAGVTCWTLAAYTA